mmetsp:Transcript_26844/g.90491  ORF Transcript_26844/g.90491 Transcript_26844/m.90491 type:complete len:234 (+) Transcript_26844:419-1120(+)
MHFLLSRSLSPQDAGVGEGVVGLNDDGVVAVHCLKDGVRVGEPDRVRVQVEDVEAVLHHESLEQHLASLEEGEGDLVEHCVVERGRPGRLEPSRPPHAGQRGEGVPEGGADVAFEGEDEHVVEAHRAEVEHQVEPRPHRPRPAHAQKHHLAVGGRRRDGASQCVGLLEVAADAVTRHRGHVHAEGGRVPRPGRLCPLAIEHCECRVAEVVAVRGGEPGGATRRRRPDRQGGRC